MRSSYGPTSTTATPGTTAASAPSFPLTCWCWGRPCTCMPSSTAASQRDLDGDLDLNRQRRLLAADGSPSHLPGHFAQQLRAVVVVGLRPRRRVGVHRVH